MLEILAYRKLKKRRDDKAAQQEQEKKDEKATQQAPDKKDAKSEDGSSPATDEKQDLTEMPLLDAEDVAFLSTLIDDEHHRPALPPRSCTPQLSIGTSSEDDRASTSTRRLALAPSPSPTKGRGMAALEADTEKEKEEEAHRSTRDRLSFLWRKAKPEKSMALVVATPPGELVVVEEKDNEEKKERKKEQDDKKKKKDNERAGDREQEAGKDGRKSPSAVDKEPIPPKDSDEDIAKVLKDLNMSAKGNRAFSISAETAELTKKFNLVLHDLIEGVPTAYNDLVRLFDDREGTLNKAFDKLPAPMKKIVTQLPDKVTESLGPEVLAAAAEAGGIKIALDATTAKGEKPKGKSAMKMAAKTMMAPGALQQIVTKPGAIASMLRAIVATLKARWPAFISTNIVFSVAVFLLLFVLWYCYKRGREARLEREGQVDGADRIEEVSDDATTTTVVIEEAGESDEDDKIKREPLLLTASEARSPSSRGSRSSDGEDDDRERRRRRRREDDEK